MKINQIGPNQTILTLNNGTQIGFSYNTPVVARIGSGGQAYRTEQKFSVTTSRHVGQLLGHMGWNSKDAELRPQSFFEGLS